MLRKIKLDRAQIAFWRIVLIFMMPMLLVYWRIIPFDYHVPTMMTVMLFVFYIVHKDKLTAQEMGIPKKTSFKDFLIYLAFTVLAAALIIIFAKKLELQNLGNVLKHPAFLALFIPISVLQEFAYRSVLMPELHHIFDEDSQIIIANAGIFSILHIMYGGPQVVLPLTMIGGLALATIWKYKPNFYLISFTHIVLNFVAVYYGFFSIAH